MRIVMTRRGGLQLPDGVNTTLFELANSFEDHGISVTVVGGSSADDSEITVVHPAARGVETQSVRPYRTGEPDINGVTASWLRRGKRLIRELKPDAIIHHDGPLPLNLPVPTLSVTYNALRSHTRLRQKYKRFAQGRGGHPIAVCTEIRDALARELDVDAATVPILPPVVNLEAYHALPLADRMNAVLHRGTLPYENPLATLEAFRKTAAPTVLYVTGPVTREIRQALAAMPGRIRNRIELLGVISALTERQLLGRVRAVAYPRRYSTPTVSSSLLEAYASGTPVVGSSMVSKDVLQHGKQGLVSPRWRDDEPAQMLSQLMHDDYVWEGLSKSARTTAERHAASRVATQYMKVLSDRFTVFRPKTRS